MSKNSNTLATWHKVRLIGKDPWCWERMTAGRERDDRRWDGWMASPTQWMWVWISSQSWWWTEKPGVLQSMGSQRAGHDWETELKSYMFHWRGERLASPVFWPGKFHGLYSLWSRKESGTTEGLSLALTCMYMKGWSALAVWFADFFLNLLNILDKITMWRQAHVN